VLRNLSARSGAASASVLRLNDVRDAMISGCRAPAGPDGFLTVGGKKSRNIGLSGNDLSAARKAVQVDPSLPAGSVKTL